MRESAVRASGSGLVVALEGRHEGFGHALLSGLSTGVKQGSGYRRTFGSGWRGQGARRCHAKSSNSTSRPSRNWRPEFERLVAHIPASEDAKTIHLGARRGTYSVKSGEKKYYLANLPAATDLRTLAATIKARWICEQAHQQLKEELGLDHFEGRSWQGLHSPRPDDNDCLRLPATSAPCIRGAEKKINGPPPQPTMPAVRCGLTHHASAGTRMALEPPFQRPLSL